MTRDDAHLETNGNFCACGNGNYFFCASILFCVGGSKVVISNLPQKAHKFHFTQCCVVLKYVFLFNVINLLFTLVELFENVCFACVFRKGVVCHPL